MEALKKITVINIDDATTVFSPKGRFVEMKNRYCYGLSFCLKGQITYTHKGTEYISDPEHAILLPQAETYKLYGNKEGCFPVIDFFCNDFITDSFKVYSIKDPEPYIKDFEKIKSLFLFDRNKPLIYSIFYGMIDRLMREQQPKNDILYPAIKYLENNISNSELNNSLLASKANISEIYFRKLFIEKMGITPKQYILDVRMQKAKRLLTESEYSISAIAEECGFSSVYSFSRAFKEKIALSPTEYAKKNKIFKL